MNAIEALFGSVRGMQVRKRILGINV